MTLAENFEIIVNYISGNFIETFVIMFILVIVIWALFNRELFIKKVENEQISFVAMIFGVVLAVSNFFVQPKPLTITSLSATGDTLNVIVISAITIIAMFILIAGLIFIYPRDE